MRAPVLLIIFNRSDTTARVLAEIMKAKPPKLFVFADGPRQDRPDDITKCAAARAVIDRVDWDCEVVKLYSDVNIGCGRGPATGISWVFEHTERAIILEDDCVPHPSFFPFCDELLEKYRDDERVMHIAGKNLHGGREGTRFSYFFSNYNISWGWATWRRAWRYHDMALTIWPELRDTPWLMDIVENPRAVAFFREVFDRAHVRHGEVDFWDYQWAFACWAENGLSILPSVMLVSNIGFGHPDATHTKSADGFLAASPDLEEMVFPLRHPTYVRRTLDADRYFIDQILLPPSDPPQQSFLRRFCPPLTSFIEERPWLTDPKLFGRKLLQKTFAMIGMTKRT